ncbi:MAG: hypothetical protein NVS3B20_08820 [Polyangiales bacterium]
MPRALTKESRKRVGLPKVHARPYRWSFVALVVVIATTPMLLAAYYRTAVITVVVAFALVPLLQWWERREAQVRERLFLNGEEAVARVLEVEPGGAREHDRTVRLEFFADKARVSATVMGSPLARRGLRPGDDVVVVYDRIEPTRCLIVERILRGRASEV